MIIQKIKNNYFFISCYRLLKIFLYRLIYSTGIFKLFYPHDLNSNLDKTKKYKLVLCHNGGGGTVSYMKNKYKDVKNVLFLRNTITADKDYLYSIENSNTGRRIYIKPEKLSETASLLDSVHIIAVESYMSLSFILNFIASLNIPVEYDLHDYHCIWYETHFIHKGKFLTKDELEKSCLKYGFKKITFQQWHNIWEGFFPSVEKINAFSQSSKNIFAEYYPEFSDKVVIIPHSLNYIKCGKITSIPKQFCIGIFGIIRGADKGCDIVKSFLEFSKDKEYHIYINGELNPSCMVAAANIHYMGKYDVDKLDKIIEEQGISSVLFPSICPETFSYTVSELIHVGIPLVSFNLGAQAEKISNYKYGQIIEENTNEAILNALKKAYEKGQRREFKDEK